MARRIVIITLFGALACASVALVWPTNTDALFSEPFMIYAGDNTSPSFAESQIPISKARLTSDERIKKLSARTVDLMGKLKKTSEELNLHFVGSLNFSPESGTISSSGALLQTQKCSFRFWLPSMQVTRWDNGELEISLIQAYGFPHALPVRPRWTENQAFEIGRRFLQTLLDGSQVNMVRDEAHFSPQPAGDSAGQWVLKWKRAEGHGYPFEDAEFQVQIPEGYCPVAVQIPEITPYEERADSPISLERAFSIANKDAPKTATEWTKPDSPHVVKGHLLWHFYYEDPKNFRGGEPVYIDAYTGEEVGYFEP